MSVVIQVTKTDNELFLIACNPFSSYRIGQIQSGSGFQVDVTFTLSAGTYVSPAILNGTTKNLSTTQITSIPAGNYSLALVGVNWGGPGAFAAAVNGVAVTAPPPPAVGGVVWKPGLLAITV